MEAGKFSFKFSRQTQKNLVGSSKYAYFNNNKNNNNKNNKNNNNNKAKCRPGGTLRVLAGKNKTENRFSPYPRAGKD
jgi:hypothetical protein